MDWTKQTKIQLESILSKLKHGDCTYFLDEKKIEWLHNTLKKQNIDHSIFYPYEGATYGVLYRNEYPSVSLLRIHSIGGLSHASIMGSLYSLNLKKEIFGDIIVGNPSYVVVMQHMATYIIQNIYQIGPYNVTLEECDIKEIEDYKPSYEILTMTVASNRIDTVISRLIGTSRNSIDDKFKNKEIILNYEIATKSSYFLKDGDIFSIRKYGKYRYLGIISKSKRDKYIIKCQKYVN